MKHYKYKLIMLLLLCSSIIHGQNGGFNPSNPPEPNAIYQLLVNISPSTAGSVSGGGKYTEGQRIYVSSSANTGFKFKEWRDNNNTVVSTAQYFYYNMPAKPVILTAYYEYDPNSPGDPQTPVIPQKYALNFEAEPKNAGTFSPSNGSRYEEGQAVYLYAYPNTGFRFKEWRDGDTVISTDQYYYGFRMGDQDKTITGVFYYDPGNPSEPNQPSGVEHGLISLSQVAEQGQTLAFPIYLLNRNIEIYSAKFDVEFPDGVTVDYSNSVLSGRKNGHEIEITPQGNNAYQISIEGDTEHPFFDSDGVLLTIPISLPSTWNVGESHKVSIKNIHLSTNLGDVESSAKTGSLSIKKTEDQTIYASFHSTKFLNRVFFTNISSETATSFLWDFGDGNTSTEKQPLHVYKNSGYYDVKLVASNNSASDDITVNIGIDSENTWSVSGAFSLNKHKADVKNFTSLDELLSLVSRSVVTGNLQVNTEANETFEIDYPSLVSYLSVLNVKLEQNKRTLSFNKDGAGSNPVISVTGTPDNEQLLKDLFSNISFSNVDLLLFGSKVDFSQAENLKEQSVCSGNNSLEVNFSTISTGLTYSWVLKNTPQSITGYKTSGTGNIPVTLLENTSTEKETLEYTVSVKLGGKTLWEQEYSFVVIPTFSGKIENLFPNIDNEVQSSTVELSWGAIGQGISYDIYLWETGTVEPTIALASGVKDFRYKTECQYGKDYTWKVVAKNECTTLESEKVQFKIRRLPDLHVSEVSTSSVYAGQTASVSWTVKNDGLGATIESSWTDRIWLISVAEEGTSAEYVTLLKSVTNVSGLGVGESYQNTVDVAIPEKAIGSYYIFVATDMNVVYNIDWTPTGGASAPVPYAPSATGNPYPYLFANHSYNGGSVKEASDEGYRSDNFFYKRVDILPSPVADLIVTTSSFQTSIFSGNKMDVSWTVKNQGEKVISNASWQDAVYISLNDALDNNAIYLGAYRHKGNLEIEESYNAKLNVTIPNYLTGDYNVFIKTDATDQIFESIYEDNNQYKSSAVIQVILTPTPDLLITRFTVPESIGIKETCTIDYTVKNQGAGATIEGAWQDAIYLSPTPVFSTNTAKRVYSAWHYGNLQIDSSYVVKATVTIPDGLAGDWYFIAKTDIGNHVFEYTSEDNNEFVNSEATTILYPDLKISSIEIPEEIQTNEKFEVSWSVENIGTGRVPDIEVRDAVYISPSSMWHETTAILLTTVDYTNSTKTGEKITNKVEVTLPCLNEGTFYVHVKTDINKKVAENGLDSNNKIVSEGKMLQVSDFTIESATLAKNTIGSGEKLGLSWTVKQNENGAVSNKVVLHEFYLSTEESVNKDMVKIGSTLDTITLTSKGSVADLASTVTIPNGISGKYYIITRTNADSTICEKSFTNNYYATSALAITLSPWPDLRVTEVKAPANIVASTTIEVQYEVINEGTANVPLRKWTDKIYVSQESSLNQSAILLTEIEQERILNINGLYNEKRSVTIPASLQGGTYYILVDVNANNDLYEHQAKDNNQKATAALAIAPYPLDIAAGSFVAVSEAKWNEKISIQFTVSNKSDKNTLSSSWHDAVYLSKDDVLDASDKLLTEHKHIGDLLLGSEYETSMSVVIPQGVTGTYYLLGVADHKQANFDIDFSNNVVSQAIEIKSVPTPDLVIEELKIVDPCYSGQPVRVAYSVKNNGKGDIQNATWNDKLYLSTKQSLDNTAELLKNTLKRSETLLSGESYKDTVSISIPLSKTGNYVLFLQVDANNAIYEYNAEDNNISNVNMLVALPAPGDLIPENIQAEKQITSGEYLHVNWSITNKGMNAISSSSLKDLVYLSTDAVFDISDKLIGEFAGSVSIPSFASVERTVTSRISGVKEGEYYLLVKTDVTNSVNETDKTNNLGYSVYPVSVKLKDLPVNTVLAGTLENDFPSEYKISGDGIVKETVLVQVLSNDSLKGAINNIYIKNNGMADDINNDFSSSGQFSPNPQVYIPSVQPQYYGVNVDGYTPVGTEQEMSIQANILPFEIRSINPSFGGNNGKVTVELLGAKFNSAMEVWLEKDSTFIDADTLIYEGFHRAFAVFDLKGADIGKYSLNVFNYCEGDYALQDAFEVQGARSTDGLYTNLIMPSSSRPSRVIAVTLEFANRDNTDILHPTITVRSHAGSAIALTQAGLADKHLYVSVELQADGDPVGVLRPGSYGTVTFYAYTTGGLIFTIEKR